MLVEIAEQRQAAGYRSLRSVFILPEKAGDVVVDQLRGGGVVADDDEAWRHANPCLLPKLECLFVVAVKRFQRRLQLRRQAQRIERIALAPSLLRHLLADVFPEIPEHRHLGPWDVVGHRDARQFHDAAFDRIHEREIAHRPREERSFGIAGAAQEKRRRGQIDDARHAELAVYRFQAGNPDAGGLVVLLRFLLVVTFQFVIVLRSGLLAVAVMRLIVQHQDVLHAHQIGHDPLEHLPFGFEGVQFFATPLKQVSGHLWKGRCARAA